MKDRIAQYLNEIVSITIMLLMAVALISAQVGAGGQNGEDEGVDYDIRIVRTAAQD